MTTAKPSRKATTGSSRHPWRFPSHFRRGAFGWKGSRLAIERIHEALTEISGVARTDPIIAAEGAVRLIERLSPALEHIDSSSGAIGSAVNGAIAELVPLIAAALVEPKVRQKWLERLFVAHAEDQIPYIEWLTEFWGELCGSTELASCWADQLLDITRLALSPDRSLRGHYHGTSACLSSLYRAGRFAELLGILATEKFWPDKRWAVKALAAQGKIDEAIALAEANRSRYTSDASIDRDCEEILLADGQADRAYRAYGLSSQSSGTYLATFRAVAKRYPSVAPARILGDLISRSPGEEGKWFATAKELKLYDLALELARAGPCDPRTLIRAARDLAVREPEFAYAVGFAALHWLSRGHGHEITSTDVWSAYTHTIRAADHLGLSDTAKASVRELITGAPMGAFVSQVLRTELGLA
ncbi:MAG: hypothetical protein WCH32_16500 [Pseudomonadota bacterium]